MSLLNSCLIRVLSSKSGVLFELWSDELFEFWSDERFEFWSHEHFEFRSDELLNSGLMS